MGEAKMRVQAYQNAKDQLFAKCDDEERLVARTSIDLFERFILPNQHTGGCYLITITLHLFLKREYNIDTKPVVGFVNDGTDHIMISHAWLEHRGRKTDLTLHITAHPDVQLQGPLIVTDNLLLPGRATYSYHLNRPPEAFLELQRMLDNPATAPVVKRKELEHQQMLARATSECLMQAYLDGAPPHLGYEAMTSVLS